MNTHQLNTFSFEGKEVRVILLDGEPWFVASDVAQTLGYSNHRDAVIRHCKGGRETRLPSEGGEQTVKIIREGDVFRLILRSKLPTAQAFEAKVVEEILPSIRKTGSYGVQPLHPANLTRLQILTMAMEAEQKVQTLSCQVEAQAEDIAVLEPKAAFTDAVSRSEDTFTVSETAKALGTGQNRMFDWLTTHKYIFRVGDHFQVYQAHLDAGFFKVVIIPFEDAHGRDRSYPKVLITGKGMVMIQRRMAGEGPKPLVRPQHNSPAAS